MHDEARRLSMVGKEDRFVKVAKAKMPYTYEGMRVDEIACRSDWKLFLHGLHRTEGDLHHMVWKFNGCTNDT